MTGIEKRIHTDTMFRNAVNYFVPDADCAIQNNQIINWNEESEQPTQSEIDAEMVRLEAEWTALEYARKRQAEYPDWGTQLNKIYDDGITKWKAEMVDPIKAKYPKP
jgi:hypothetical protein